MIIQKKLTAHFLATISNIVWDYNYIDIELDLIFELILGANYMDI